MKKNAILVDMKVDNDWTFKNKLQEYSKKKWEVESCVANSLQKNKICKILIYIKYFIFPLKIYLNRRKYNYILSWQQFYGIILAFYCRLFKTKSYPKIIIMTFIYKPKKSIFNKLYYKFIKYSISSDYVRKIICFSKSEVDYYTKIFNLSSEKISYCIYGNEDKKNKVENKIKEIGEAELFFLAAGRSNRDYDFLINSIEDYKYNTVIICDNYKKKTTKNIIIKNNVYGDEYLKYMKNCFAVIIPLEDKNISSGQLVFLKAMEYGKPVIITENDSVNSYVINNYNGLIIKKTKYDLNNAMNMLLNDNELYRRLSENAKKYFNDNFTIDSFAKRISKFIL